MQTQAVMVSFIAALVALLLVFGLQQSQDGPGSDLSKSVKAKIVALRTNRMTFRKDARGRDLEPVQVEELAKLGPPALPEVVKLLGDETPDLRIWAFTVIGRIALIPQIHQRLASLKLLSQMRRI